MYWLFPFARDFFDICNDLYFWLTTPIDFLGGLTPLFLLSTGLVAFLVLCLGLRIARG